MNARSYLLLAALACFSCSPSADGSAGQADKDDYDKLAALYYEADTVIRRHDSVLVVNTRLDTVVVDTGIFTSLPYDYVLNTPAELVRAVRQGTQAEASGRPSNAAGYFQDAIRFYQTDWLRRKSGFENGGFSDLNAYYAAHTNVALLASYAYEKLGRLPEALAALAPFLANVEAEHTRIQLRYIQLCIRHYGHAATRQALAAAGRTVHRLPDQSPESDRWRVTVFGADLGLTDFNTDSLSPRQAQALILHSELYALVR